MKKLFFVLGLLCLTSLSFSQNVSTSSSQTDSKSFTFKYNKGDSYRILSTVNETVFVNKTEHHKAEIINRVSVQIPSVSEDGLKGTNEGIFMTSEKTTQNTTAEVFTYGEEYKSVFERDQFGYYTISDEYFMPTVRDVPIFPDYGIKPGDEWTAKGHEAHDLRRTFNMEKPYKIPFNAKYKYLGPQTDENGKTLYMFEVMYNLEYTMDMKVMQGINYEVPYKTAGFSHQMIFWDYEKGAIDNYYEEFEISITTNAGNVFDFVGTAKAEVSDIEHVATQKNEDTVLEKINNMELQDVSVKRDEKGLTISLDDIQFLPDSAILMESEKLKLQKIATILADYPSNDLLISGHTALRGNEKERQTLSEQRAASVADYLIQLQVRDNHHIFTQGFGAKKPVAPNNTEEGRRKNRRVEITIMDM